MPHSLRARLSCLRYKKIISDKDYDRLCKALEQEPCCETVSLEAFKQVMWERDIAIAQLKELGYEFGQKIEPKTGHWIKSSIGGAKICSICQAHMGLSSFKFCPNCGARMKSEV